MRSSILERPVGAIQFWQLLWLLLCGWIVISVAAEKEDKAEVLALDLMSSKSAGGVVEVFLGPESSRQRIELLPVFRKDTDTTMQVPVVDLCSSAFTTSGNWNVVRWPRQGDAVVVDPDSADSLRSIGVVRWTPNAGESTSPVNLMLRKGKGSNTRNISVIENNIQNDGEYPWNAAATYKAAGLKDGADYSLMIWTTSPPRNSTSGYFTIKKSTTTFENGQTSPTIDTSSNVNPKAEAEAVQRCLNFLEAQGGVYNSSSDGTFRTAGYFQGYFENSSTNREVRNTGTGSAELFLQAGEGSDKDSNPSLGNVGLDMISQSGLGMGTIALNVLQYSRRARVSEMNVVALNLGTAQNPGSVVLGGYDRALIDSSKSAVFTKGLEHPDVFQIDLQQISVSPGGSSPSLPVNTVPGTVSLSYDSQGIRLSQALIDELLPLIGNPSFDGSIGGYVYADAPKTDYSFIFNLQNGTQILPITVPASSLLVTQTSDDNPLTPLQETGRTYLALSPTADGSTNGMFLGRKFLQHVYLIDSPPSIRRFHLNVLPSPLPSSKDIVAASPSSIMIFDGYFPEPASSLPRVAPMVGGIVGGVVAICAGIFLYILWARRRRRKQAGGFHVENRSTTDAHYSYMSFDKETGLVVPVHSRSRRGHGLSKETSVRTTHTIPIRYSPTPLEKELNMRDCRYSSSPYPSRIRSPPAVEVQVPPGLRSPPPALILTDPSPISRQDRRRSSLLSSLSAVQRRKSEVSTVAREYHSSDHGDRGTNTPEPVEPIPKQTATIARMYSADEVSKIQARLSPPTTPGKPRRIKSGGIGPPTRGHTRTASLGRVMTPCEVEVERGGIISPISSRSSLKSRNGRTSTNDHHKRSASLDLLREDRREAADRLIESNEESQHKEGMESDESPKAPRGHWRQRTNSSKALPTPGKPGTPPPMLLIDSSNSDSSPSSKVHSNHSRSKSSLSTLRHFLGPDSQSGRSSEDEVYGLRAVSRDGEFMKLMGIADLIDDADLHHERSGTRESRYGQSAP